MGQVWGWRWWQQRWAMTPTMMVMYCIQSNTYHKYAFARFCIFPIPTHMLPPACLRLYWAWIVAPYYTTFKIVFNNFELFFFFIFVFVLFASAKDMNGWFVICVHVQWMAMDILCLDVWHVSFNVCIWFWYVLRNVCDGLEWMSASSSSSSSWWKTPITICAR